MKQKSISLLIAFLDSQLKEDEHSGKGFSYNIQAIDQYGDFWNFEVIISDSLEESWVTIQFKVDFKDESVWVYMGEYLNYEQVEADRWTVKYFWYRMYCLK